MSFTFKKLKNDPAKLNKIVEEVKKEFVDVSFNEVKTIIVDDNIKRGFTPVKGKGKTFKKYSKSYEKAILSGRVFPKTETRPVNLTVSGAMLDSFQVSKKEDGIVLEFTDEIAKYHNNKGEGRVHRPMLPESGGSFIKTVDDKIKALINKAMTTVLAKFK
jgi:hypothetical protein